MLEGKDRTNMLASADRDTHPDVWLRRGGAVAVAAVRRPTRAGTPTQAQGAVRPWPPVRPLRVPAVPLAVRPPPLAAAPVGEGDDVDQVLGCICRRNAAEHSSTARLPSDKARSWQERNRNSTVGQPLASRVLRLLSRSPQYTRKK